MIILNSSDIEHCLDLDELRKCMMNALKSISTQSVKNFPRTVFNLDSNSALGFMPAMDSSRKVLGYKAISVFHDNALKGLNPHQGIVVLLDPQTGLIKCLLDGSTLTALRTAAVSAAATDRLSRTESNCLALIGAGRQAIEHVRAIIRIRPIKKIYLFTRSSNSADQFINLIKSHYHLDVLIKNTPKEAVQNADIVVTCTPSTEALLDINDFREGTHINAIGASRPGFQEVSLSNHIFLKIYLDSKESCSLESDEVFEPIKSGILSSDTIIGEMGDCLTNKIKGRESNREITFFKSVGLSIEDVLAAEYFYNQAVSKSIGQEVTL